MRASLTCCLFASLAVPAICDGPPAQDAKKGFKEMIQKKLDKGFEEPYLQASLATLDAAERDLLVKLEPLGFYVMQRGPYNFEWKEGQKFLAPPRGIGVNWGGRSRKAGDKPLFMKDLAPVAGLRHVERVRFSGHPNITDDMLDWFKNMQDLWYLDIGRTRVSDAGLKRIAHLRRLRNLDLDRLEKVTDAGIAVLAQFPDLAELNLRGTGVADGVAALRQNLKLQELDLSETKVGDPSIPALAGLPELRSLILMKTRVTDEGVAAITKPGCLPSLQLLDLSETTVSDETLKRLHDPKVCPKLHILLLLRTKVTNEGVAALRKARPTLEVMEKLPGQP
jgi:hypothetical protein